MNNDYYGIKEEKPPPYSFSLAVSINPEWVKMEKRIPFTCIGTPTKWPYVNKPCTNIVDWWHPLVSQDASYCNKCCPDYYKRMFVVRWRETKLKIVADEWFNKGYGQRFAKTLDLSEAQKKNIVEIMGFLTWDFYYLKGKITYLTSKKARELFMAWLSKDGVYK